MKRLIKIKKEQGRNDLIITVNTVLSKRNVNNIEDMITFCIDLQVDEWVLLQFLVQGNAIDNNESISFEDELKTINLIADKYSEIKDILHIVPKFTYPMAQLYSEKVLKKDFPEIRQMCGAGTNFAYLNNKGELYPCDRYQTSILEMNNSKEINLVPNDFWDIWSLNGYSDLFEKSEGKDLYQNISPCNSCKFLQRQCFPCPAILHNKKEVTGNNCSLLLDLINRED